MKRLFFLTLFFSLLAGGSLAQAGDTRPSWFLVEDSGEILAVEAQSQTVINVTSDLEENATHPNWSQDGMYISFLIVEEVVNRNETPYGIAAWVEFDDDSFEINTVPRCERSDVTCTDASIAGEWLVFTAVRVSDDYPVLYAYNIADDELEVLQSGGFYPNDASNRWEDDTYIAIGRYGTSRETARIFEVPGPGYETSYSTGLPGVAHLGCNFESISQVGLGSRSIVEVRFDQSYETIEFEGTVGQGRVWRNCRAEQPDF